MVTTLPEETPMPSATLLPPPVTPSITLSNGSVLSTSGEGSGVSDPLVDARRQATERSLPVYKFVLTGGPCAGKTTALKHMRDFFHDKGFRVFAVPEAATAMFTNGATIQDLDDPQFTYAFQWSILQLQMQQEDSFERVAHVCGKPSVLLCDRGLMDGSVYMPPQEWNRLVKANGMDEVTLRDGRYDGVFHLVTAAVGAEEHYSLGNNEARSEPVELAVEVDSKTEEAYMGHPRHFVFDNSTAFDAKIERITRAASRLAGLPCRPRRAGKFLLAQPPPPVHEFPVPAIEFEAEKVFMRRASVEEGEAVMPHLSTGPDHRTRVSSESFSEKRGRNGNFVYTFTTFSSYEDGTVTEVTRPVSAAQYEDLKAERADPSRPKVVQRRVAFLWERQAFELHTDVEPAFGVSVLYRRSETCSLMVEYVMSLCTANDTTGIVECFAYSFSGQLNNRVDSPLYDLPIHGTAQCRVHYFPAARLEGGELSLPTFLSVEE